MIFMCCCGQILSRQVRKWCGNSKEMKWEWCSNGLLDPGYDRCEYELRIAQGYRFYLIDIKIVATNPLNFMVTMLVCVNSIPK